MTEIYGIYAILLLISTTITLYLAFYSWNKRLNPNAFFFSIVMAAVSIWSICEALEMASISISTKILWSQFSYIGIVLIGPSFLLFTMSYTDHKKYLKKWFAAALMIIPIFKQVMVDINTAIPLVLIVNKLVSNSMKHAFPDGRTGSININFREDEDGYVLIVEDDGIGFPEGIDFKNTDSLGLRIFNSLTEQIEGNITLDKSEGSKFII